MKYVLTAAEMKACDNNTIHKIGIPSMVLMERAALGVADELIRRLGGTKINLLVVSGVGNNGGDGLAIGRILAERGWKVTFYMDGNRDKMTAETREQVKILENLGFSIQSKLEDAEYDMVVDALFGIGLSREVSGDYARDIMKINEYGRQGSYICAVDIPSGISADTGKVLGCAVRADLTVAFAFAKRGHLLYPGREYCGELAVRDIGITEKSFDNQRPEAFCYEEAKIRDLLPERAPFGNKGTFGKVLLLAGSRDMCGACLLCGNAVLRSGAGMVKIITPDCNRQIIQQSFPEAMLYTYEEMPDEEKVKQSLAWCDVVVAGPGMGMSDASFFLMKQVLEEKNHPMVIDADGLNLLAAHKELWKLAALRVQGRTILTPHPGELCRLLSEDMDFYRENREGMVFALANQLGCVVAAKDAVTVVAGAGLEQLYINTSGNDGMATAGSGDVLAGVMGGLLAQGMDVFSAACLGVYLHGLAGERAAALNGRRGMTASDITGALMQVMNKLPEGREKKTCGLAGGRCGRQVFEIQEVR